MGKDYIEAEYTVGEMSDKNYWTKLANEMRRTSTSESEREWRNSDQVRADESNDRLDKTRDDVMRKRAFQRVCGGSWIDMPRFQRECGLDCRFTTLGFRLIIRLRQRKC